MLFTVACLFRCFCFLGRFIVYWKKSCCGLSNVFGMVAIVKRNVFMRRLVLHLFCETNVVGGSRGVFRRH